MSTIPNDGVLPALKNARPFHTQKHELTPLPARFPSGNRAGLPKLRALEYEIQQP
jgi:hypothetical protein